MALEALYPILDATTVPLRKGPPVTQHDIGALRVVEVFAYPHENDPAVADLTKIDVHFIVVGVDKTMAEQQRAALLAWLASYPEPERLAHGPSYIEVGAVIGSQEAAFRLFALGEVLGLWSVMTPERLGIEGAQADDLAGRGFVMMSGFREST